MKDLYTELQWLPRMPGDFEDRIRFLLGDPSNPAGSEGGLLGAEIQVLASSALDLVSLNGLGQAIDRARISGSDLRPLIPFRMAILSNSTTQLTTQALVASAARHGIALEVVQTLHDQAAQEALTPDSTVNSSAPDAVLFAIDYRAVPLKLSFGDRKSAAATVKGVMGYFKTLRAAIKVNCRALCIFQTLAPPVEALFGGLDRALPGTMRWLIECINRELAQTVLESGDVLLDVAALAETVGLARWHNMHLWNMAKFSFSDEFIPLYADHVARTVAAIRGKSRKALILDLDNTVWGGVIGDDGLEGIAIAQGDATGEAHLAVQRMALDLRQRGVILAVCSKNTDEMARAPFEKHPEMLLKLDHFAAFQANWNDKATNIQAITEKLSLGLDAMVFLDDSPVERCLVRKILPQVAVPELPEDPAYYARTLSAAGYFEAVAFAPEDRERDGFYQDNAKRTSLQNQAGDVSAYLASLHMTITFQSFDAMGRARIIQLINKSNQYNLTGRRYTDPEVAEAEKNPRVFTLQVRLADIFGDNGMISVVICRPAGEGEWEIDTWLMSCRVLGRKVEQMVLREVLRNARANGIRRLIGAYKPTERNKLVIDHYEKLGFQKLSESKSGETKWEFVIGREAEPEPTPMKVLELRAAM